MSSADACDESGSTRSILAIGGVASLCCLFTAPAAFVAGGGLSAGAAAALGGTIAQILVTALTLGVLAGTITAWRRVRGPGGATDGCRCDQ
ncbi:hypothetical protein [Halococcoides cellulosivorans]|uniref:Uncharacterized protein n=1 Tax=Halococcoides cellulosivorans TaxID=1679096 RepID=A0A2R4WZK1_9EURY|nr:hypothetical protein [Halococcoides cellulosivorans]AWB26973.1 hypothetical protein HARCEL1_04225 [Halococcoides cellulosivorans]